MNESKHAVVEARFSLPAQAGVSQAVRPAMRAKRQLVCGLKAEREAAGEIHALQIIGNILLEAISKDIALHCRRFVRARWQPSQVPAQRKMPADFVFRSAAHVERRQR